MCEGGGGRRRSRRTRTGAHNQKQELHTKMCGERLKTKMQLPEVKSRGESSENQMLEESQVRLGPAN